MSGNAVGFWFALGVLVREMVPHVLTWHRKRAAAREECARLGHTWDEPFWAMGSRMRNCKRCKRQEHYRAEDQTWH